MKDIYGTESDGVLERRCNAYGEPAVYAFAAANRDGGINSVMATYERQLATCRNRVPPSRNSVQQSGQ